ncbi:class I SAM-dependent methyltransferase [Streptomyces sp. 769]|uniref:class I SAM-dependent methyltransferase n=1 Tax=Streptomyces sp. 769 TaxID=1262452 RepID=UPI00057D0DFA|nr:class I SAM-dependent methyltransferase [Streptomyces sp. 769]AJC59838.1 SAM-dependent methyltransferase [Streptomyces sp. 769]
MTQDSTRQRGLDSLASKERFDALLAKIDDAEAFDTSLGVETNRPVEPWEIEEANDTTLLNNSRYSPTPVQTIRQAIAASPLRYEDISFVDFGSGKGRAMLVASEFPFRKVIGVEFSRRLCETARENVERYRGPRKCGTVDVRCQDAAAFTIPDDASFFYFYEPFTVAVAQQVLRNIEASVRSHPRQAVLCLVGAGLLAALDGPSPWTQLGETLASPDDPYFDTRLYVNGTQEHSTDGTA